VYKLVVPHCAFYSVSWNQFPSAPFSHFQSVFFPYYVRPWFTPIRNNGYNYWFEAFTAILLLSFYVSWESNVTAKQSDLGTVEVFIHMREGLISLWLIQKTTNYRIEKKNVFTLHISPLSSTHLWLRFSNLFNPSKKNSFGCAKIWNRKSQRLISALAYSVFKSLSSLNLCPVNLKIWVPKTKWLFSWKRLKELLLNFT
jgi:hypothetical protein